MPITVILTATQLLAVFEELVSRIAAIRKAGTDAELQVVIVSAEELNQVTLRKIDARLNS